MLLPASLPGSFHRLLEASIKYPLRARLIHSTKPEKVQIYELFVNILEPPRNPQSPISLKTVLTPRCQSQFQFFDCGCCFKWGTTQVQINCDKNFAKTGDSVAIFGAIDTRNANQDLLSCLIRLEQWRIIVSPHYTHQKIHFYHLSHFFVQNKISKGSRQQFQMIMKIPKTITSSTAIGKHLGLYFCFRAIFRHSDCSSITQLKFNIQIQSTNPEIYQNKSIKKPSNWLPLQYPLFTNYKMVPYYSDYSNLKEVILQKQFMRLSMRNKYLSGFDQNSSKLNSQVNLIRSEMMQSDNYYYSHEMERQNNISNPYLEKSRNINAVKNGGLMPYF